MKLNYERNSRWSLLSFTPVVLIPQVAWGWVDAYQYHFILGQQNSLLHLVIKFIVEPWHLSYFYVRLKAKSELLYCHSKVVRECPFYSKFCFRNYTPFITDLSAPLVTHAGIAFVLVGGHFFWSPLTSFGSLILLRGTRQHLYNA